MQILYLFVLSFIGQNVSEKVRISNVSFACFYGGTIWCIGPCQNIDTKEQNLTSGCNYEFSHVCDYNAVCFC